MKIQVNYPPQPLPPPTTVDILGLPYETAQVLRELLYNHVSGSDNGPRGLLSELGTRLHKAGVKATSFTLSVYDYDLQPRKALDRDCQRITVSRFHIK